MQLPVGCDNFKDLIDKRLDFVDKTLWIKEILDDPSIQMAVIARPRRFGKTLNLSMLHCFLAKEVYGQSTGGLFDGLKIAGCGEKYLCIKADILLFLFHLKMLRTTHLSVRMIIYAN